uniref:SWIM-type domain-containing protein n=1 Tax=Lactuca sativa TaxID=4236 RepID=A0A9R1VM09_LACSA|nr:hypothetical protein LSAT_V11C500283920 [Lactuca sativa]
MASPSFIGKYLTVDVHYRGLFAPNPLKYLDPETIIVRDVDFGGFTYKEFLLWLRDLTKGSCNDVYYCSRKETLAEGIIRINSDANYWEFVEATYTPETKLDVYIDHQKNQSLIGLTMRCYHMVTDDKVVCPVHDEKQEWDKMVPVIGMKFANPMQLKLCVTNYAVKNWYDLWYEKSDHNRLLVKYCKVKKNKKNKGCPFRLWATWMTNERSFQIKSLVDNHNCSRVFKFGSIVSYKWIWNHFMIEILQKPKMSVRKLKAKVSKRFNLIASVGQCRNARRYAFKEIKCTLKEHYAKTWSYGEELRRTNPGSTVKMDVDVMPDGTTYFSKFYVSLKGVKNGWIQGCRRVIGLDGCFLKGIYRGQLLAAVGWDANNHIYPLAWAVVTVESKETWKWFVDLHLDDIEMGCGHGLTLISDQHKLEPLAYDYLIERDPKTWSKAFFETDRACDAYENGVSESFNSVIDDARKRPLITMLEEIRIYVMERLCTQKSKGSSWGDLHICPSIRLKLSKIKGLQRFWRVVPSGYQEFEVRLGYDAYSIDLGKKTCVCRAWQLTSYPCVHAYAVISNLNRDSEDYVSPWLTTTMFGNAYMYTIKAINGNDMWSDVDYIKPLPPKKRRMPGRPSTKRKKDQIERELKGNKHTVLKRGKVKVELAQEDTREPNRGYPRLYGSVRFGVFSNSVRLRLVLARYEDVDQPKVEVEAQGQGEGVVGGIEEHVEVEAQVEVEVQDGEDQAAVEVQGQGEGQEGEELAALQDPFGQDDQGQDAVQDPVEEEHM